MKTRSECTCVCHNSNFGALHFVACCVPDEIKEEEGIFDKYVFPVYDIALPLTHINQDGEEEYSGTETYEVWDQACSTVCCCEDGGEAENIAFTLNVAYRKNNP